MARQVFVFSFAMQKTANADLWPLLLTLLFPKYDSYKNHHAVCIHMQKQVDTESVSPKHWIKIRILYKMSEIPMHFPLPLLD